MAKKSIMFVLLAFVLLISASAVLADQDGTACWCNVDEYGCWVTNEDGVTKDYIMFWTEDARTLFLGADSTATVAPLPEGGKLALKGPFWFDRDHDNGRGMLWSSDAIECKQDSTVFPGGWKCNGVYYSEIFGSGEGLID